jgi:hypothetical protein
MMMRGLACACKTGVKTKKRKTPIIIGRKKFCIVKRMVFVFW